MRRGIDLWLAAAALLAVGLAFERGRHRLLGGMAIAFPFLLLQPRFAAWSPAQASAYCGALSLGLYAYGCAHAPRPGRAAGPLVATLATAAALAFAQTFTHATAAAGLALGILAAGRHAAGTHAVAAIVLPLLWLRGHHYADLPAASALLLAATGLVARRHAAWALAPAAAALWLAYRG